MKLSNQTLGKIREIAKANRYGSRIELGLKWHTVNGEEQDFYNHYSNTDGEYDLANLTPWANVKSIDFEMVNGKLLLDFYISGKDGLNNLLIEVNESNEITGAWRDIQSPALKLNIPA
jgi:hypothetical protein